jgi:hypothetical protein
VIDSFDVELRLLDSEQYPPTGGSLPGDLGGNLGSQHALFRPLGSSGEERHAGDDEHHHQHKRNEAETAQTAILAPRTDSGHCSPPHPGLGLRYVEGGRMVPG